MTRRTALAIIGATASIRLHANTTPTIEVGPDKPLGEPAATQGEP